MYCTYLYCLTLITNQICADLIVISVAQTISCTFWEQPSQAILQEKTTNFTTWMNYDLILVIWAIPTKWNKIGSSNFRKSAHSCTFYGSTVSLSCNEKTKQFGHLGDQWSLAAAEMKIPIVLDRKYIYQLVAPVCLQQAWAFHRQCTGSLILPLYATQPRRDFRVRGWIKLPWTAWIPSYPASV